LLGGLCLGKSKVLHGSYIPWCVIDPGKNYDHEGVVLLTSRIMILRRNMLLQIGVSIIQRQPEGIPLEPRLTPVRLIVIRFDGLVGCRHQIIEAFESQVVLFFAMLLAHTNDEYFHRLPGQFSQKHVFDDL